MLHDRQMTVQIKRIYEHPDHADGYRVLVDRLWPRGVSKHSAELDVWMKEVAPSTALRIQFNHRPELFEEFAASYRSELDANPAADELRALIREHDSLTLLYGARDTAVNHAVVLRDYLTGR